MPDSSGPTVSTQYSHLVGIGCPPLVAPTDRSAFYRQRPRSVSGAVAVPRRSWGRSARPAAGPRAPAAGRRLALVPRPPLRVQEPDPLAAGAEAHRADQLPAEAFVGG